MWMMVGDDNNANRRREFKRTVDHNAKKKDGLILHLPRVCEESITAACMPGRCCLDGELR